MVSLRGPKLKIFAAVLAVIALAAGVYMMFFESRGLVKTTATISNIERTHNTGDTDDTFTPTVEYIPETELIKAEMLDVDGYDAEALVDEAIKNLV